MRRLASLLVLLMLGLACSSAAAEDLPLPAFRARFSVTALGIPAGDADFQLERADAGRWRFVARILPNALARTLGVEERRQESLFRYVDGTLLAQEFTESREDGETITASARFDWQQGEVSVTEQDGQRQVPIETRPLYDEASLYLALMLDLAAERLPEAYQVVGDGKLRSYALQRTGEQRIGTPLGELAAIGVKRERPGSDRRTVLWCAPTYAYLPVLIVQERKGQEVLRMTLGEVEGLAPR